MIGSKIPEGFRLKKDVERVTDKTPSNHSHYVSYVQPFQCPYLKQVKFKIRILKIKIKP